MEPTAKSRLPILKPAVLQRYGNAAQEVEAFCLPVSYDIACSRSSRRRSSRRTTVAAIRRAISAQGETVLDLGSGSGKACYIIAQIVGAGGKVIGVDFNPPMLELARKYQEIDRRSARLS